MPNYDVVIVGAGMTGSALAATLCHPGLDPGSSADLKILLLDKQFPDFSDPGKADHRPITLSLASQKILSNLDLWPTLKPLATAIQEVEVSEQGGFGQARFKAVDHKVDALGFVVEYCHLRKALFEAVSEIEKITTKKIISIQNEANQSMLEFEDESGLRKVSASLIIGADGSHSIVRDLLHIESIEKDLDQVALTANVEFKDIDNRVAFERFTKKGVIGLLPLTQKNHYGLVWSMSGQQFKACEELDDAELLKLFTESFGDSFGRVLKFSKSGSYRLDNIMSEKQLAERAVLLGNAAHTLHPIAAQGFNLTLRDIAVLSEVILEAKASGLGIGSETILEKYLHWREKDQAVIAKITGSIVSVFGLRLPCMSKLRGLGLLGIDLLPPVKNRIAQQLMGMAGKLPRLIRC